MPVDRASLDALRATVEDAVAAAERDFARIVEASRSIATDDEHDPEGAGLAVERAQIVARLEQARDHLRDLDLARQRLDDGRYGDCESCHRPIDPDRLLALPAARTCIECARHAGRGSR